MKRNNHGFKLASKNQRNHTYIIFHLSWFPSRNHNLPSFLVPFLITLYPIYFPFILIAVLGWHLLCCLLGLHERHGQARPVCQFSHTEETERQSSGNSFHQEMAGEETCHRSLENMRATFTNAFIFFLSKILFPIPPPILTSF